MESLVEENARLRRENTELRFANEGLERRVQELECRVKGLLRALEEAQRAGKRQVAPFSWHEPKAHPAKPGRKSGSRYGCRSRRPIPAEMDQTLEAELPDCCPHCGGELEETRIKKQYQTEIPQPQVERIEFRIHVGGASVADEGSRAGIRARPRMRWAARRRNWERGRWLWPRN